MTTANQSAAERNITLVAVANIQPSNYNPRKRFDETGLDELAESIKQQGVLQPITVRPIANTGRYEIVFGERRYRATVIAGSEEIPAIISELSDEEAQEMAVTENLQRKDVTPTEEANAYTSDSQHHKEQDDWRVGNSCSKFSNPRDNIGHNLRNRSKQRTHIHIYTSYLVRVNNL